jgi:hypothetical protein
VVVVIPTPEAVETYLGSDWTYLETGVMVEPINASGVRQPSKPSTNRKTLW